MKTWDILKATYLVALLYFSNENTAYLFEISRYIKYFERRNKHLCGIKGGGVRLIGYSSQARSGTPFLLRLLDSLMIGNILTKFKKNLCADFLGNDLYLTIYANGLIKTALY